MTGCGKERISSNELAVVGNNLHPTCEQRITGIGAMMNTNTADGDPVFVRYAASTRWPAAIAPTSTRCSTLMRSIGRTESNRRHRG